MKPSTILQHSDYSALIPYAYVLSPHYQGQW